MLRHGLSREEQATVCMVVIPYGIWRAICLYCRSCRCEACGALYGTVVGCTIEMEKWRACTNLMASETEFSVNIDELVSLDEEARIIERLRLLGLYHSHCSEDMCPSEYDLHFLRLTHLIWAIVGKTKDKASIGVRCFSYADGPIREIPCIIR
jgi:proteasome lid subunit RPN8/RPN11